MTNCVRNIKAGCGAMDSEDEIVVPGNLRATVCVSSQVGCRMGCTFCATGKTVVLFHACMSFVEAQWD